MRITVHISDDLGPKLKQATHNDGVSLSASDCKGSGRISETTAGKNRWQKAAWLDPPRVRDICCLG